MAAEYNWDNLEVGRIDLNHSENFFRRRHTAHEKLDEINLELLTIMDDKENVKNVKHPENDNKIPSNKSTPSEKILKKKEKSDCATKKPLSDTNAAPRRNKNFSTVPSLIKYAEIYKKRKQRIQQKMLEEAKQLREFHSKPAPNFNEPKPKKKERKMIPTTVPTTPLVLKHSKETEEKKNRLIAEYNKPKTLKIIARDPKVLREEPFKPQKANHQIDMKPFNLHMEKRLEQRKQYDKHYKQLLHERKTQEEIDKKKREEEQMKEIRKNIVFKARPNPFK